MGKKGGGDKFWECLLALQADSSHNSAKKEKKPVSYCIIQKKMADKHWKSKFTLLQVDTSGTLTVTLICFVHR